MNEAASYPRCRYRSRTNQPPLQYTSRDYKCAAIDERDNIQSMAFPSAEATTKKEYADSPCQKSKLSPTSRRYARQMMLSAAFKKTGLKSNCNGITKEHKLTLTVAAATDNERSRILPSMSLPLTNEPATTAIYLSRLQMRSH
mmetsp:Transcript_15262/g.27001  ORF Transcript_15262/g.27001 Transcript_15262/m.27001 type:complete len:143 (-) Transcript_15262:146-574(-)